jgi:nuclear pore complex protein Nup98-Nup96
LNIGAFGQQTSIFGNTSTTGTTSLFGGGQPQQANAFGAQKQQIFGQPQPTTSLFQTQQPQQTSLFGQTAPNTGTGLFSSTPSAFAQPTTINNLPPGTGIAKFQAQQETDALLKGSTTSYIQTKQQCITFMKEYGEKSLEELRVEDYTANRKGPQPASSGLFGGGNQNSFFGANQTSTSTGGFTGFGQQSTAQPIFGAANTNTLGQTSAFGTNNSAFNQSGGGGGLFGKPLQTPATTASAFGGFGTTTSNFGVAKPFNATAPTTNLFGQTPAAPTFGQPAPNTFGTTSTFGQPQQNAPSLFGASSTAPPAWNAGTSTASTAFNTNAGSNMFGATAAKPAFGATAFGAAPNAFGATPAPAASGFNFGQQNTGGNLFGQKPATNLFGQPAQQQPNSSISFGGNTGSSLFGTNTQPSGGLFGSNPAQNTANTGGGLFGTSATSGFGSNLGAMPFGQNQPSLFNT